MFLETRSTNYSSNSVGLVNTNSSHYSAETSNILNTGIWNIKYSDLKILMPPLGRGAFGVVYKAEYHSTMVAVKTYVGDDPTGETTTDWAREISNLAKLHHVSTFHCFL